MCAYNIGTFGYNVAIDPGGDDYSSIFFNKKGIVHVIQVRTKKIACQLNTFILSSKECYLPVPNLKIKVLLIESPSGKDYFAYTSMYDTRNYRNFGKTLY